MHKDSDDLSRYSIPGIPEVYGIGIGARRVTYQSQQIRALNLPFHLEAASKIKHGSKVAVVGAGLSGITVAAGLCWRGCDVTIFERADRAFHLFSGNSQRLIHPNIFKWPSPESTESKTDLPFLNWEAGTPATVVGQVMQGWTTDKRPMCLYGMQVVCLKPEASGKVYLMAKKCGKSPGRLVHENVYDAVIMAVGFGEERRVPGIVSPSYWDMDNLMQDRISTSSPAKYLISGTGDGAISDLVRCLLRDFNFGALCGCESGLMNSRFMNAIAQVEKNAPADQLVAAAYYQAEYARIGVPSGLEKMFAETSRRHVTATINIGNGPFLNQNAQPLNRFLLHALNHQGLIDNVLTGELIRGEVSNNGRIRTFFDPSSRLAELEFDQVIVRHGPKHEDEGVLSKEQVHTLRSKTPLTDDPTILPAWDASFYRRINRRTPFPVAFDGSLKAKAALFGWVGPEELANETKRAQAAHRKLNRRIG